MTQLNKKQVWELLWLAQLLLDNIDEEALSEPEQTYFVAAEQYIQDSLALL